MTVELITGFAGTPHINSDDIGAFQAGIVGPGDYALATGNRLKATMSNANTIAVQSGDAVLNGRHVHLTGTTTATVQSGTQGQKRKDKVVLRYTKNTTTGVETCSLVVIKGTNATGTPADPAHNTGSILDGVTTHDMPLYRIPIDGITVGTLVPLFNVLKPMKDVWDSLTQLILWSGQSSKTGVLTLSQTVANFRELIVEGVDDDNYQRTFRIRAVEGASTLQFVGANITTGAMFGKAVFYRITGTQFAINGQRIHQMEGSTSDGQCLTITRIVGVQ